MRMVLTKPFNLIAFNLMWLGLVLGRADWLWLVGPLVLTYLALLIISNTLRPTQILLPAAIGVSIDALITGLGFMSFQGTTWLLPLWLITLWLAFSSTLSLSLAVFGRSKPIAALCGAVAFPFNYGVGERVGAVAFVEAYWPSVLALSLTWALMLPLLFNVVENSWRLKRALA